MASFVISLKPIIFSFLDALPLEFVDFEPTFIHNLIRDKLAFAMSIVIGELALVKGSIVFDVDSLPLCLAFRP